MSKKQQERKKQKRKEIAKKRVLARRNKLRRDSSQNIKAARLDRKFRKKIDPIIKDDAKRKIMEEIKNEKILSKLEKNAEILKMLENEYVTEIEQKKQINDQLESEGHLSLKDKLNALDSQTREQMTEEQKNTGMIDLTEKKD